MISVYSTITVLRQPIWPIKMRLKEYSLFSITAMKKNPAVLPVVACIVTGVSMAALYLIRLAVQAPDVSWNTSKNPEPWNAYQNKNYKFIQAEPFDIKNYKHPRPPI